MKSHDSVTASIIADSQEAEHDRDKLSRRQFLNRLVSVGLEASVVVSPRFPHLLRRVVDNYNLKTHKQSR